MCIFILSYFLPSVTSSDIYFCFFLYIFSFSFHRHTIQFFSILIIYIYSSSFLLFFFVFQKWKKKYSIMTVDHCTVGSFLVLFLWIPFFFFHSASSSFFHLCCFDSLRNEGWVWPIFLMSQRCSVKCVVIYAHLPVHCRFSF